MAPAVNAEELAALGHEQGEALPAKSAGVVVGRGGRPAGRGGGGREAGWEDAWAEGRRVGREEMVRLLLALTDRDRQLLELLGEHGYLTTDDAEVLLFAARRRAQRRLLRLRPEVAKLSRGGALIQLRNASGLGLIMRRPQHEPGPWRRQVSVYALRQKGALVLAALQDLDGLETKALVQSAANTVRYQAHLQHDLGAIGFFTGLVRASLQLPDQGLYSWLGEAAMRRRYQERGGRSAPDGWGRYLVGGQEIGFQLEWDCGTEALRVLVEKAEAYEEFYFERPGGERNHVLWVADWEPRERSLRQALERIGPDPRYVHHWTTSARLLREEGHLGQLWRSLQGGDRLSLPELPGRPAPAERALEACLGRSGWWTRRAVSADASGGVK